MADVYERGQVVIPKYIRDMFKLTPGRRVNFRVEDRKIIMEPADEVLEEFRRICSEADMTSAQVRKSIEAMRKKRGREMMHVPGR